MNKAERERFELRDCGAHKGKGLFARVPIKKDEFIIEYTGKHLPTEVADTLGTRYLFDLENGTTIDGSPMSNTARWINHSCDPNCEAYNEEDHIMIYACKDIAPGEELTFDYDQDYFDTFLADNCRCGSAKHRTKSAA